MPFCVLQGLQPCKCTTTLDSCKVCCAKSKKDLCTPYRENTTGNTFDIFDGRPCQDVEQGICIKVYLVRSIILAKYTITSTLS